jgi:hypothetical protein
MAEPTVDGKVTTIASGAQGTAAEAIMRKIVAYDGMS